MPISCPARPLRTIGGSVALSTLSSLSACTDATAAAGSWIVLLAALPLTAGLAYALGALRSRQQARRDLRAAREAARHADQLHGGWAWQTDAAHRLETWRAPGRPAAATSPLFDAAAPDPALLARLHAEASFAGLRLRTRFAIDGSQGWELRGVPRLDDSGSFAGFAGSARPTDDDDALRLAACALTPLLAANPMPALLALATPQGWQLLQLNPAAQLLWPALGTGSALADTLADLPGALADAIEGLSAKGEQDIQGWRLSPVGPPPGGAQALLLVRLPDTQPGAQAQAQESDTFSFTLSHDLRAPIRVVEGFTRIVKEDYGRQLDRVGQDHLDRVLGAAARMNLMIDALLTLARLSQQPLARQRVNLSQLAGYVVDDLRRAAPDRACELDIEPGLSAWGDPTLLRLVLENLLGNAWKYTGRCGQAQIALHSVPHGDTMAFVVRDNGAGFDMRSAERLFGLFQRLHSASDFPGHGVGLASVRRIVQRHGGQIWAEAEAGKGAAFFFTLPG